MIMLHVRFSPSGFESGVMLLCEAESGNVGLAMVRVRGVVLGQLLLGLEGRLDH